MESYDLVVIGAGPGGYVCAIRAAQLGLKTALVEKNAALGGTCLNIGCIPSKALLESSELFYAAGHSFEAHGIETGPVRLNLSSMMARKDRIVRELTDGVALLMKRNKVSVLKGRGILKGPGRVVVEGGAATLEAGAKAVVIATGGAPVELPFLKFDGKRVVTSTDALAFGEVPKRLVVVGAGAIGLELGSVWRRLGAEVTVVELLPRAAPFADAQMSVLLQRYLKARGMVFKLKSRVTGGKIQPEGVALGVEDESGGSETLLCDKVLVSVGRKPLTGTAGLKEAGVAMEKGFVKVDAARKTNLPGVYAIGDVTGGPMLAHKASQEGIAVAETLVGKVGHVNYDAIPSVVYTNPELACVGLTEEECKKRGIPYKVGKNYFKGNGRAKSLGETDGMAKIIAHADSGRILGVHILGPRASCMVSEAVLAMEFKAGAGELAGICHAHPTLSEVLKEAALAVDKRAIHG